MSKIESGNQTGEKEIVEITAPHQGACYLTPQPDKPPFVELGDPVEPKWPPDPNAKVPRQTVALIECSKLFTDVDHTGPPGTVVEICIKNGASVEEGEVIMRIAVEPGAKVAERPSTDPKAVVASLKKTAASLKQRLDDADGRGQRGPRRI